MISIASKHNTNGLCSNSWWRISYAIRLRQRIICGCRMHENELNGNSAALRCVFKRSIQSWFTLFYSFVCDENAANKYNAHQSFIVRTAMHRASSQRNELVSITANSYANLLETVRSVFGDCNMITSQDLAHRQVCIQFSFIYCDDSLSQMPSEAAIYGRSLR